MMLTGIIVRPEAFSTRNMIWAFEAVSFLGFESCISFMALSPMGVAALSSPNMLAEKFSIIEPYAGWPLGSSGKSFSKKGPNSLPSIPTTPPFSPTFISPIQRVRAPVSPSDISKPVFAFAKVEFIISLNIAVFPEKIS